jgi:hypothetical protein
VLETVVKTLTNLGDACYLILITRIIGPCRRCGCANKFFTAEDAGQRREKGIENEFYFFDHNDLHAIVMIILEQLHRFHWRLDGTRTSVTLRCFASSAVNQSLIDIDRLQPFIKISMKYAQRFKCKGHVLRRAVRVAGWLRGGAFLCPLRWRPRAAGRSPRGSEVPLRWGRAVTLQSTASNRRRTNRIRFLLLRTG